MMIKRVMGTVILTTALTPVAMAADLPETYTMAAPEIYTQPAAVYDWTGIYVGGHAGYGWGDVDFEAEIPDPVNATPTTERSFDIDGFLGGVQVGYNAQIGSLIAGIEADFSWSGADGDVVVDPGGGPIATTVTGDVEWMSTIRARLGLPMDRFMPFVAGGLAIAEFDGAATNLPLGVGGAFINASDSRTHYGWTIGGGVESALTDQLTLKVEYLYADFGEKTYTFSGAAGSFDADADFDMHVVRAGLNFFF